MSWKVKKFDELTNYELYSILKERSDIFVVEQTCFYLDPDGLDMASYHLYKKENEEIIAYLRIFPREIVGDNAAIGRVIVKKDYRGKGIGKELIVEALKFITEVLKEHNVELHAQDHLRDFYGSFGFKVVSDVYLDASIPHVTMTWTNRDN